jgi:polyhydroxybutyrate depolymerase
VTPDPALNWRLVSTAYRGAAVIEILAAVFLPLMGAPLAAAEPVQQQPAMSEPVPGMERRTVFHDGIEREYFVHRPKAGGERLPVVIALHGYTSTATGFAAAHGLNRHADEHGYVVVYPQGSHFLASDSQGHAFRVTSWNDLAANRGPALEGPHCTADSDRYPCPPECGECKRCDWTACYDDVGFIRKVLDAVQSGYSTDEQRYYLLGVSNGGMMALRLGCNLSDRFAAIAPIIAQLAPGYECGPATDLPMLHLFGGKDDTVRYDGKAGSDGFIYTSAAKTAATWATAMACKQGPTHWENRDSRNAGLLCTAYSDCRVAGQEVVSCMDPEGEHAWPGQFVQGMPATCVTAEQFESLPGQPHCPEASGAYEHFGMDLVWDFMSRYRRAGMPGSLPAEAE